MEDVETQVGLGEVASGPPEEGSLLDSLAEDRKLVSETQEVYLRIPGYNKVRLYARYRLLEGKEIDRIGRNVRKQFNSEYERVLYASVDSFIMSCTGIFYELDVGSERKPLTYEGRPIDGYTIDLARALKFADQISPDAAARSIVFGLFNWNELAMLQHNIALGRWMGNTSAEVDEGFFGGNL